jgi:hypothetical protein
VSCELGKQRILKRITDCADYKRISQIEETKGFEKVDWLNGRLVDKEHLLLTL